MSDEGWTEEKVRSTLEASEEHKKVLIKRAYQDLLGREADSEGIDYFLAKMTQEGWDETRVRQAIRESEEFKSKTGQ